MRVKITIGIGLIAGALTSCSFDPKETLAKKKHDNSSSSADATAGRFKDAAYLCVPEATGDEGSAALVDTVTWDGEISVIVAASCATSGCHSTGATAPELTTYEQAKAAGDAVVEQVVDGLMPTSGTLPADQVALFQAWSEGGYLKAAGAPAKPKPKAKDDDVLESNRCPVPADTPADDGAGTAGGAAGGAAAVTGYTQVKDFIDGSCASAGCHVAGAQAPDLSDFATAKAGGLRSNVRVQADTMPPGGGLTADEQALFQKWVDGGYAEQGE